MDIVCCVSFLLSFECKVQGSSVLQSNCQCDLLTMKALKLLSKIKGVKGNKSFQHLSLLHFLLNVWSLHGSYFGFFKLLKLFGFGFCFVILCLLTIHHTGSMRK
jgi:hypothetical protein